MTAPQIPTPEAADALTPGEQMPSSGRSATSEEAGEISPAAPEEAAVTSGAGDANANTWDGAETQREAATERGKAAGSAGEMNADQPFGRRALCPASCGGLRTRTSCGGPGWWLRRL
jgi:hypothetical protein